MTSNGAQRAEGIILRKYLLRETSFILVVYTKEFGKIKGVVKGARNPAPQFAGNFEIFSRCQLLFYRRKRTKLGLITQCEAVEYFLPVRKEIERLTYANYFVELVDITCNEDDPNQAVFDVLEESLTLLSAGVSAKRAARIFEIKFLGALGLSPNLEGCAECGSKSGGSGMLFSVRDGCVFCGGCRASEKALFPVSAGTVNFIRKVQTSPVERLPQVKVSRDVGVEIERILKGFLEFHLDRRARSLDFIKQLEKAGMA